MITKIVPFLVIGLVIGAVAGSALTLLAKPAKTVTKSKPVYLKLKAGLTRTELQKVVGTPTGVLQSSMKVTIPAGCAEFDGKAVNGTPSWIAIVC